MFYRILRENTNTPAMTCHGAEKRDSICFWYDLPPNKLLSGQENLSNLDKIRIINLNIAMR